MTAEELATVCGLLQRDFELVVEGFEHVVERTVAHALDGGLDGAEAGDHDDERLLGARLQFAQQVGAFAIGQADVHEDKVEGVLVHQFVGASDRARGGNVVAPLTQLLLQILADDQVVLKHDDFFNGHGNAN